MDCSNCGYWTASSRTRRWKLRRYGRGPRKKPPEPPDPPDLSQSGQKRRATLPRASRPSTGINYRCCRQPCHNPLYADHRRLVAPFIACSRRPFQRVSSTYYHHYRPPQADKTGRHGTNPSKHHTPIATHMHQFFRRTLNNITHAYTTGTTLLTSTLKRIHQSLCHSDTPTGQIDDKHSNSPNQLTVSPFSPSTWHIPFLDLNFFEKRGLFSTYRPSAFLTSTRLRERPSLSNLSSRLTDIVSNTMSWLRQPTGQTSTMPPAPISTGPHHPSRIRETDGTFSIQTSTTNDNSNLAHLEQLHPANSPNKVIAPSHHNCTNHGMQTCLPLASFKPFTTAPTRITQESHPLPFCLPCNYHSTGVIHPPVPAFIYQASLTDTISTISGDRPSSMSGGINDPYGTAMNKFHPHALILINPRTQSLALN